MLDKWDTVLILCLGHLVDISFPFSSNSSCLHLYRWNHENHCKQCEELVAVWLWASDINMKDLDYQGNQRSFISHASFALVDLWSFGHLQKLWSTSCKGSHALWGEKDTVGPGFAIAGLDGVSRSYLELTSCFPIASFITLLWPLPTFHCSRTF